MSCQHSSSSEGFSYDSSNSTELGTSDASNEDLGSLSYFTVPEAAEYISSLTKGGTYYVKVVDYSTTSCSALKTALKNLVVGIYISLDLSESVVEIGSSAFCGCSSLESIEIPGSVTSIGNYAFYNCTSLESVIIPSSVTKIGSLAFCYTSLTSAYFEDSQGWVVNSEKIDESDLQDVSIAAKCLSETYRSWDWTEK